MKQEKTDGCQYCQMPAIGADAIAALILVKDKTIGNQVWACKTHSLSSYLCSKVKIVPMGEAVARLF